MDIVHVVVLALVQGLTEFLPISSSGHLVLLPHVVNWPDQGLAFDVAVHVGSLIAVVAYFQRDLAVIIVDWFASIRARRPVGKSRLGWAVIVATIPGGALGYLVNSIASDVLRSPLVIGAATVFCGLLLWWADRAGTQTRGESELSWRDVLLIGAAQALALIPGTSRSGITITAGMALGLTRSAAARFSFLLSIPLIAAAGLLQGLEAVQAGAATDWFGLCAGVVTAAVSAYICIHFFLKFVERIGMLPFVIYRLALGGAILLLL